MDRRQHREAVIETRASVERELASWRGLRGDWQVICDGARAAHNSQRLAHAETKLQECRHQVACLQTLLRG